MKSVNRPATTSQTVAATTTEAGEAQQLTGTFCKESDDFFIFIFAYLFRVWADHALVLCFNVSSSPLHLRALAMGLHALRLPLHVSHCLGDQVSCLLGMAGRPRLCELPGLEHEHEGDSLHHISVIESTTECFDCTWPKQTELT